MQAPAPATHSGQQPARPALPGQQGILEVWERVGAVNVGFHAVQAGGGVFWVCLGL